MTAFIDINGKQGTSLCQHVRHLFSNALMTEMFKNENSDRKGGGGAGLEFGLINFGHS